MILLRDVNTLLNLMECCTLAAIEIIGTPRNTPSGELMRLVALGYSGAIYLPHARRIGLKGIKNWLPSRQLDLTSSKRFIPFQ